MKGNKNIDPNKIIQTLESTDLSEILNAVKKGDFSTQDVSEICDELDDLILETYKTKFSLKLKTFSLEKPDSSLRDVVVEMLKLLPNDVKESHITILTEFVIEKWKSFSSKMAA